ncbi:hypothetical protein LIER_30010 [Lithospermum erythrorhizon]|uniref:Uncharacterized protein n=1 Tax=Lithospermum erythrorhizon TaxID=34254 RepID=A0AAV3RPR6_LITER
MAFFPPSPEYTPSVRHAVVAGPRTSFIVLTWTTAASMRVAFGSGLVRTLEDREQLLDHAVAVLDEAIWGTPAVGLHYQDLESSLSDRLDALEALAPF